MDRLTIDYFPPVLKEIREFKEICAAEQPEFESLHDSVFSDLEDVFVDAAGEYGIKRFEKMLGISPTTADLDERRFAIRAKLLDRRPYTSKQLNAMLAQLCGASGYNCAISADAYEMTVKVALTVKDQFDAVKALLERVVPANMIINIDFLYNKHEDLVGMTHAEIALKTHNQIRNEVL